MGFGIPLRNSAGLGVGGLVSLVGSATRKLAPVPVLDLNFTTGPLDSRITFTRASSATYFDASGVMQTASSNVPRFDYEPTTHAALGLLIEPQTTNFILGSDAPVSQSVTIGAFQVVWLSFYGTGTISYTGLATGSLIGVGAFPSRVSTTFTTSSSGTLNLVITGAVQFAQLETNVFSPTSYIKTTVSQVTRSADSATVAGTNFSSWFANGPGAFFSEYSARSLNTTPVSGSPPFAVYGATTSDSISMVLTQTTAEGLCYTGGVDQGIPPVSGAYSANTYYRQAISYSTNNTQVSINGSNGSVDTTFTIPPGIISMSIGKNTKTFTILNGYVKRLQWYSAAMSSAQLQALTA